MAGLEQQNTSIKPEQIIEIIIRYKWLIILPLCLFMTAGAFYSFIAPKVYEASTTILIQPQKVPTEYVQSIVSSDLDSRLNTISHQILSRSNLEKIIDQFGLYENNPQMYLEDKIANMRQRIEVKIENSRSRNRGTDIFYVSFHGKDPDQVMQIANALASYFMDENLKVREAQAIGTSEFLESELVKLQAVLEEKEKMLSEYRSKHLGGLPAELEANLRTLDRLQVQLSNKQNAISELNNSINLINSQISRAEELQEESYSLTPDGEIYTSGKAGGTLTSTQQLYEAKKLELEELESKYKDKHPDVLKAKRQLENLEEKLEQEKQEAESDAETETADAAASGEETDESKLSEKADSFIFEQKLQLKQIRNKISLYEAEIKQLEKSMAQIQKRVQDTPKREQELQSLQRDYSNIRDNYNSLLARKLEAQLAVNMEKKQKGEQFRILDYARRPQKPISPSVKKILVLSLAIGLGIGGGLCFLLEFFNSTVKSAENIETEFGLPILTVISSLKPPKKTFSFGNIALLITVLYLGAISLIFALIHIQGIDKVAAMVKAKLNI